MVHRLLVVASSLLFLHTASAAYAGPPVNGGFESGDLTGFSFQGNGTAQVLTAAQLAPLGPSQGSYFALVSNGPGDQGGHPDVATLTSASFALTSPGTLTFDYDFLTAEFTGADPGGASNLDSYVISLLPAGGSATILASGNTGATAFTYINGNGNPATAPDGTSVIEHTGYLTGTATLAAGSYSLRFTVADAGDNNFDSALAVDNIHVVPAPVPESSTALSLTGLCLMLGIVRLRAVWRSRPIDMLSGTKK